ncbi:MliC family protein [Celeribacter indicus]|uniref:Lysozyme inhibitor n=1 Tax=Celeribacter indicus TaxID=1208324 RepID=A0A0B5DTA0_9RHOB|nr:MliC family protein [Celeribacter indicus]AJE46284.1 lysozyme inhibitor [Celeribacter indicus]
MAPDRSRPLALALLLVPLAATAQDVPETVPAPEVVTYTCERGVEIDVVYAGQDYAVVQAEGRLLSLGRAVSASGARYLGATGKVSAYEWWEKGGEAMLNYFDAEVGESVTLYAFCKAG